MQIVNGYVCRDCADVALAKRNIDPAHPKDDPSRAAVAARREDAKPAPHMGMLIDLRA
ncbi:MAG: hypothetical protein ACOYM8_05570 [Caulobacterales bacterium]|jgi:hypothetical protein